MILTATETRQTNPENKEMDEMKNGNKAYPPKSTNTDDEFIEDNFFNDATFLDMPRVANNNHMLFKKVIF